MVLLILAAIWAVVLIPPWIRSRRDLRPAQSMASFQRRLTVLERATPYSDAYSDVMDLDASSHDELDPGVGDDDPAGGARVDLIWDGPVDAVTPAGAELGVVAQLPPRKTRATPALAAVGASSRRALQRRRQIFFVLLVGAVISLAAAAVVNSIVGWGIHGSLSLLFLGYVFLLVRHHRRALERSVKVRYLAPTRAPRPAVVVLHGTAR